jgi:secreted Zn-dependent insulinase-like peptidase
VLLELFVQVASKPCFHQLRTTERLGYSISCTASDMQVGGAGPLWCTQSRACP